jgi:uncharacterized protein with HEPN domain
MRPEKLYLTDIVEAAARLPKEFINRFPEIPWVDIIAFRNIAVHEYFAIRWDIAWTAATEEVPVLKEQSE